MSRLRAGSFGVCTQSANADSLREKYIIVSAWIRTKDVRDGYAGLWLRCDGADSTLYLDNMYRLGVEGTAEWKRYSLKAYIPTEVKWISFGGLFTGSGDAWFDEFHLEAFSSGRLPPASTEAASYLENALSIIADYSMMRDSVNWQQLRDTIKALSWGARTTTDTYASLQFALAALGDHHSFLQMQQHTPAEKRTSFVSSESNTPIGIRGELLKSRFAYLAIPAFANNVDSAEKAFASQVQERIAALDSAAPCGWIVDLRLNSGGNMWPMILGLAPILNDGYFGASVGPHGDRVQWWIKEGSVGAGFTTYVRMPVASYRLRNSDAPIAVLLGPVTASSGEAVAIAFRGRSGVRFLGQSTAGLSTGNSRFPLSDGAVMFLTTAVDADRTGKIYRSSIDPDEVIHSAARNVDIQSDPAIDAAIAWLKSQRACDSK